MYFDDAPTQSTRAPVQVLDAAPLEMQAPTTIARSDSVDVPALARLARDLGPRDLPAIISEAKRIGTELGKVLDPTGEGTAAFYRWSTQNRDGSQGVVEGPTISLMDDLGGAWGRIVSQTEIIEERGPRVTLRVRVIDLLTLRLEERPFVAFLRPPPPSMAKRHDEAERWRVSQLQSAESKAIRSVLERVIPTSVQQAAMDAAREAAAAARLGGRSLVDATRAALEGYKRLPTPPRQELLELYVGRPAAEWTSFDLQALREPYARLKRGELTVAGFEAEAQARHGSREEGEEGTPAPRGDRLADLGLGVDSSTPAPAANPGQGRATAGAGASDQKRAELYAQLGKLRAAHPEIVARLQAQHLGDAPLNARTAVGKVTALVAAVEAAVAAPALPPEPWDGPTGPALVAECQDLIDALPLDQVVSAREAAGVIGPIEEATEPQLRALLVGLVALIPESTDG